MRNSDSICYHFWQKKKNASPSQLHVSNAAFLAAQNQVHHNSLVALFASKCGAIENHHVKVCEHIQCLREHSDATLTKISDSILLGDKSNNVCELGRDPLISRSIKPNPNACQFPSRDKQKAFAASSSKVSKDSQFSATIPADPVAPTDISQLSSAELTKYIDSLPWTD